LRSRRRLNSSWSQSLAVEGVFMTQQVTHSLPHRKVFGNKVIPNHPGTGKIYRDPRCAPLRTLPPLPARPLSRGSAFASPIFITILENCNPQLARK
jgi:hypothetical protein